MILTTHALVGAAVGKYIQSPIILTAILIPFHYFLDTFRHGEYLGQESKTKEVIGKVLFDLILGLSIITTYIIILHPPIQIIQSILLGAFLSMLPDFITFLHWKLHFPYLEKIYKFHQWVHKYTRGSKERIWNLRNATNDIIFSLIAIIILFLL